MKEEKNEIILFENQEVKLEVNLKEETVWLTQKQMAELFDKDRRTITRHIQNIYKDEELEENSVCSFFEHTRVNSKRGIIFRKWATKILKDYMIKGYAINQKRLEYLEKTIKLVDIATRIDEKLENNEAKEILKVIGGYSKALDLLDNYDHKTLKKIKGRTDERKIEYNECINIINTLKFNEKSSLFAVERDRGLESIIGNIYQGFGGQDIYKSIEEKGANI